MGEVGERRIAGECGSCGRKVRCGAPTGHQDDYCDDYPNCKPRPTRGEIVNDKKTEPTFDSNGYPTDETLEIIKTWNCVGKESRAAFMEFVGKAWRYGDTYFRKDGNRWSVSTFGWSGNEDLIGAMQENFLFWSLCWVQSNRGGHYIFEEEND